MKKLKGIGKIAICIMVAVLLSSTVYADEGAVAESAAIADADNGGIAESVAIADANNDTTSIVGTKVETYPDGDGYATIADASVDLEVIGESYATGYAYGEGITPIDSYGKRAYSGVIIDGYAASYDCYSSAWLSGIASASASTEDDTANVLADIVTYADGNADADGIADADAWVGPSDPISPQPPKPEPSPSPSPSPSPGLNVYISSVQFVSPGENDLTNENINKEWVKITNSGSNSVDMTGWILQDDDGFGENRRPFDGLILEPGATVTVHTGKGQNSDTDRYMEYSRYIWANEGDTAILKDDTGKIVDQVTCKGSCEY